MGLQRMILRTSLSVLFWFMNSCIYGNETDRVALLAFKSKIIQDPLQAMNSWNDSLSVCEWRGIKCGNQNRRVEILDLHSSRLVGSISPYIGNLTFLKFIHLQNNSFQGEIPQEVGKLLELKYFNMSNNFLEGEIPSNLSHCSDLISIGLRFNHLSGKLPSEFGSLSKLITLDLQINSVTGGIPPSFGNLTNLITLFLSRNSLDESIPDSLSRLKNLTRFSIGGNQFSGMVPQWLYNLSSLKTIIIADNNFSGTLPPTIGLTLQNLQVFIIGINQLMGPIPASLSNASRLEHLDIAQNDFFGSISINFGGLKNLWRLNFEYNSLGLGEANDLSFLNSLTNCSNLQILSLSRNNFGGSLPNSIANLSTELRAFVLGGNRIVGSIPLGFEELINLTVLGLEFNFFTDSIPNGIGKLQNLQRLALQANRLSELIPSSLGNLTKLYELSLAQNFLTGNIPLSFENLKQLQILQISENNLGGSIPKLPSNLIVINLTYNSLTGSIPFEVGSLKNLEVFDVSENILSGQIPNSLGDCLSLERLYMEGNFFQGNIPSSLSSLRVIQELDLSRNNLSGGIPRNLETLFSLRRLNLSLNELEGEVPFEGIFKNMSVFSLTGNPKLCGGISKLQLPACSIKKSEKHRKPVSFKVVITIVIVLVFLILVIFVILYWRRKKPRSEPSSTFSFADQLLRVSYGELLKATNGFSTNNLIGIGSYGSVYKGVIDQDQTVVAVKVLNLQRKGASKSFMSECKALRNIRHRNLLQVLTSCSSVDYQGKDFKALVFEFMPNGSLENWLYPSMDGHHELKNLSLSERLNIAIDVASALDYLHHHSETTIVHSDLKPSNVLLDIDMTAHVSDFGLANILSGSSNVSGQLQSNSIAVKGSIGYVAPEYGMGSGVSTYGDVYSYGILLLEMFTGKRPTNEMFSDGLSLHNFVKMALPERVMEIVDSCLLSEDQNQCEHNEDIDNDIHQSEGRRRVWECLVSTLRIGVACSLESPRDRMVMTDVVADFCLIRDVYQGEGTSYPLLSNSG